MEEPFSRKEPFPMKEPFSRIETPSMIETPCKEVLRRIDVVSNLCHGIFMSRPRFLSDRAWLVDELEFFCHALEPLQRQVKQVSSGIVDQTRLSTYERLYSIYIGELIAAEGTLTLLSEKIVALTDRKDVALHDGSIRKGSKRMRTIPASPVLLDGTIESILLELKRQWTSLHLCQQVHSLIEAYSEMKFRAVLNSASERGHKELLRFLTDTFNHDTSLLEHTLLAPSFVSHEDFMQSSLAPKADVDSQTEDYGKALREASFAGNEKLVRTLFHHKIDVNAQEGYLGNALQAASLGGNAEIVKILINKKAHVNAQGGYHGNALQAASFAGHQDVVQFLLDHQADVNAQGGHYGNALQAASFAGHKDIVKCLFHNKADVNAQGGFYGNALQAASFAGHEKIVKFLFHKEANVNAQGGLYGNALQAAAFADHEEIVKFLINEGIEVNAQAGSYGNALQAASFAGREKIVRILLDDGADVDAQGGYHGNALQAASLTGREEIVRTLLDHGADVNAKGGHHGNALQAASFVGHQKIVQILLGHGADVDAEGLHGTALEAASSNGHEDIVELLITFGPVNDFRDEYYYALVKQITVWLLGNRFLQSLLAKAFKEDIQIETFGENLAQLLERYGEDLVELTHQRKLKSAAEHFVSHRWQIVEAMFSLCASMKTAEGKSEAIVTDSRIAAFLEERLAMMVDHSDELKPKLSKDDLDEVKKYLVSMTTPLHSFLGSVCRLVYSNPLEAVGAELLRGFESCTRSCVTRFELSWRIEEYLDKEIVRSRSGKIDRRIVGSLLTLSGDAQKCYANSCEVYMKWNWPNSYNILLDALALGSDGKALRKYITDSAFVLRIIMPTHNFDRYFFHDARVRLILSW